MSVSQNQKIEEAQPWVRMLWRLLTGLACGLALAMVYAKTLQAHSSETSSRTDAKDIAQSELRLIKIASPAINPVEARLGKRMVLGDVSTHEDIAYYSVYGKTLKDVVAQMRLTGPSDRNGNVLREYAGVAIPDYSWDIDWQEVDNRCLLTSVSISVTTTISLPEWKNDDTATPSERAEWRRYSRDLLTHERKHKTYHDEGAEELRESLLALPAKSTCAELEQDMHSAYRRMIARVEDRNARFDCQEYRCGQTAAWSRIRHQPGT